MVRPEEVELEALTPNPSHPAPHPVPLSLRGERGLRGEGEERGRGEGARGVPAGRGEGLIVARCYRGGMQLLKIRLSSGEMLHSLQPTGAHFPLASRVRVHIKVDTPVIFVP